MQGLNRIVLNISFGVEIRVTKCNKCHWVLAIKSKAINPLNTPIKVQLK